MEKLNSLPMINDYYQYVCNTPLTMFQNTTMLEEINELDSDALECLAGASLPSSLHSLLLLTRQIDTVSQADNYLYQVKQLVQTTDNIVARFYFILNYLFLYLKLIQKNASNTQCKLFALCLLCFDYNRCIA